MKEDEEEEKKENAAKKKSITLKVSSLKDKLIHISNISDNDNELALVVRKINLLLLKRNPRYEGMSYRKDFNQSWKRKGKVESDNSKQEQVVCYGCN
ncbi:hypothetical protein REPUB_Repub09cG0009100 [Reevesia pubescens]